MTDTDLHVPSMSCGSCIRHIGDALGDLDGVDTVDVRLAERRVRVRHDADRAPVGQLIEALADAGYDATFQAA